MRRRIPVGFVVLLITATAALAAPGVSAASAASCTVGPPAGEQAPQFNGPGTGISESAPGGYTCNVKWKALVTPQYESGGVWHQVTDIFGFSHPSPTTFFGAGTNKVWQDGLYIPDGSQADTPACGFNWKYLVQFFNSNNVVFQQAQSPELHKLGSC